MKKKSAYLWQEFPPVEVYLDELTQIKDEFESTCAKYTVGVDRYELDTFSELSTLKVRRIERFTIRGHSPSAELTLDRNAVRLSVYELDAKDRGLFERLKDILLKARRPWGFLRHLSVLGGVSLGPLMYGAFCLSRGQPASASYWFFVTVQLVLLTVLTVHLSDHQHAIIRNQNRSDIEPFLSRRKDDILLSVFSALIGAVLAILVGKLL